MKTELKLSVGQESQVSVSSARLSGYSFALNIFYSVSFIFLLWLIVTQHEPKG